MLCSTDTYLCPTLTHVIILNDFIFPNHSWCRRVRVYIMSSVRFCVSWYKCYNSYSNENDIIIAHYTSFIWVFPKHKHVIQNTLHVTFQTSPYLWSTDSSDQRCVTMSVSRHREMWLHWIMIFSQNFIGVDVLVFEYHAP